MVVTYSRLTEIAPANFTQVHSFKNTAGRVHFLLGLTIYTVRHVHSQIKYVIHMTSQMIQIFYPHSWPCALLT